MTIRCEGENRPSRPCNIVCYENHANDSRVTVEGQVTQTLNSRMGTGGATFR